MNHKPAEVAVEQATKFELIISLKAAKQIWLTVPANALAIADRSHYMTEQFKLQSER